MRRMFAIHEGFYCHDWYQNVQHKMHENKNPALLHAKFKEHFKIFFIISQLNIISYPFFRFLPDNKKKLCVEWERKVNIFFLKPPTLDLKSFMVPSRALRKMKLFLFGFPFLSLSLAPRHPLWEKYRVTVFLVKFVYSLRIYFSEHVPNIKWTF